MTDSPIYDRVIVPIVSLLLLITGAFHVRADDAAIRENAKLLARLDSLIANHSVIIKNKEGKIARLRMECANTVSPSRRLEALRKLYFEYKVYNPDSAMVYAKAASLLAKEVYPDNPDCQASCLLDEAFIYATEGFSEEAVAKLESIDPTLLSLNEKLKFFHTAQYIYSSRALFNSNGMDKSDPCLIKANAYRDSLVRLDPDHLTQMLWAPIAKSVEVEKDKYRPDLEAVEILERAVNSSTEASRDNAINAYWLSRHYKMVNDNVKWVRYLAMAAIYDAEIENREIAAITELAEWLFDHDDLDRAYTFLIYSSEQANAYNNRARVLNVSNVLPTVRDAYHEAIIQRDNRLRQYLILLIILSVVLIISMVIIYVENRRLKRTRRELARTNEKLEATICDRDKAIADLEKVNQTLSETNNTLIEANKVKQGLVALLFRLTSDYINALDDFRKKLLRKFKMKAYVELGVMLNDQELLRDHYKEFYDAFDHTVLSIFPNFIEEYNATVTEEYKMDPEAIEKKHTLNTRVRIYALRRLGVEKSADIAHMLNISIRTVYNNRN